MGRSTNNKPVIGVESRTVEGAGKNFLTTKRVAHAIKGFMQVKVGTELSVCKYWVL